MEKIVAIGGGVGPMAGVELHKKIIENTEAGGTDQGHLEVHHLSRSADIRDRTKFLLEEAMDNPAEGMFRTMQAIEAAADILGREAVAGVPCNTFHAPKIFDRLMELMEASGSKVRLLHMLNETADYIQKMLPTAKNIGLMSTTGTRTVGVYRQILEPKGFKILEVADERQAELHDSIYNKEWGIKAVTPVSERARNNFLKYVAELKEAGAEAIILGCTEIPLALPETEFEKVPLVDPVLALARALVREAAPEKLKK